MLDEHIKILALASIFIIIYGSVMTTRVKYDSRIKQLIAVYMMFQSEDAYPLRLCWSNCA